LARFRGEYDYSIDAKGRVNIPAKFRKALAPEASETFAICRAPNNCLRAYPQNVWEKYEDELATRPQTSGAIRHLRLLQSTLSDSKLDAQGRIALRNKQIKIAGIKKNVTLVGHYGFIEIWDTERYREYIGSGEDFDKVFFDSVEVGMQKK
jgi:MraZ protein